MESNQPPSEFHRPVVLITGGSGLIGSRLVGRLNPDYELVGFDVTPPAEGSPLDYIETDLTDDASTQSSLEMLRRRHGGRIASVIHLAAYYDFTGDPSPMYDKLTVGGTRRLLRSLRHGAFEVEQFVFSSSLLVMEPDEEGRQISEFSPTRGSWDYPKSKLDAEEAIREERGEFPTVILRIAGVYDEKCHSLPVSQQIARIFERQFESHVFPGDRAHGQALIHLDDLADCVLAVIEHRKSLATEELFLIAEPDVMSYGELQDEIGELIHGTDEWLTIRVPKLVAKAGAWVQERIADDEHKPFIRPWMIDLADDHLAANVSHARSMLSWNPKRRLRETLPAMIDFLKRDPVAFYETNKLPVPAGLAAAK